MAHLIDTSNARNNIAYVGEAPWHGLGQKLTAGLSIDDWRREAGLDFQVERSIVEYKNSQGAPHNFADRHVLYRSDTGAPLSVVSDRYKIVQPAEVMEFFRDLTKAGGFELETAGSLAGGRRIWALARVSDGANVIGQDRVLPYILLATSFDASLSTVAKFTGVRVVCQNTLSMAAPLGERNAEGPVVSSVSVAHNDVFKPSEVRSKLGLALTAFDAFLIRSRLLAEKELKPDQVEDILYSLIEPTISTPKDKPAPDVRQSRSYRRLMDLFSGQAIGSDLTAGPTAWQLVNSVTQWVDHERGRSRDTGLDSAWFGQGNALKNRAVDLAVLA